MASVDETYLTTRDVIVYPIAILIVIFFMYGFYIPLFFVSLRSLHRKKSQMRNVKLYFICTILLFIFVTIGNASSTTYYVYRSVISYNAIRTGEFSGYQAFTEKRYSLALQCIFNLRDVLPVFANMAADLLLIHRCYIIWGSSKRFAYPLTFLSFSMNAVGFASSIMLSIGGHRYTTSEGDALFDRGNSIYVSYIFMHMMFNVLLTLLTAGRIWWISRQVRLLMGRKVNRYAAIVAMILESGAIYPILTILYFGFDGTFTNPSRYSSSFCLQAASIAPTLIIARVALGKTMDSVDQVVQTLRLSDGVGMSVDTGQDEGITSTDSSTR